METARSDVRAAYSALGNVSNDLKSTTWLVRTHRHPQHCGHHPPPCGYSDKPRFSAASFPGCLATCLFGHTVDVLQEAGEVKTGVALPNPKRILVAPATARLQVWAYEVFLDFFRVYFCTTVLARAIRFGFGSATTQVVPRLEREREGEEKCWLELTRWTFPCICAFCREEQIAHFAKNGSHESSKSITIPCAMSFRIVIHRINKIR